MDHMKASDRKYLAPAPRVTFWVPLLAAGALSVLWLLLSRLI
jgi:hypothetical protein